MSTAKYIPELDKFLLWQNGRPKLVSRQTLEDCCCQGTGPECWERATWGWAICSVGCQAGKPIYPFAAGSLSYALSTFKRQAVKRPAGWQPPAAVPGCSDTSWKRIGVNLEVCTLPEETITDPPALISSFLDCIPVPAFGVGNDLGALFPQIPHANGSPDPKGYGMLYNQNGFNTIPNPFPCGALVGDAGWVDDCFVVDQVYEGGEPAGNAWIHQWGNGLGGNAGAPFVFVLCAPVGHVANINVLSSNLGGGAIWATGQLYWIPCSIPGSSLVCPCEACADVYSAVIPAGAFVEDSGCVQGGRMRWDVSWAQQILTLTRDPSNPCVWLSKDATFTIRERLWVGEQCEDLQFDNTTVVTAKFTLIGGGGGMWNLTAMTAHIPSWSRASDDPCPLGAYASDQPGVGGVVVE